MKIVVALIIFSVIIIVHELGHFLLAKKNGISVTEFSLGMGPRIVSYKGKETRYSIKLFPIGGSCMMVGEDELSDDPNSFNKKSVWARISVIVAGPLFNFILAFVIAIFFVQGTGVLLPTVTNVAKNSPAEKAGLQEGDIITNIGGSNVDLYNDIVMYNYFNPLTSKAFEITYERDGKENSTTITPENLTKYMLGFSYTQEEAETKILALVEDGAAQKAGLQVGDILKSINGKTIKSGTEYANYVSEHPLTEEAVEIVYEREGKEHTVQVTPVATESKWLGVEFNNSNFSKPSGVFDTLKYSYIEVKYFIKSVVISLKELVQMNVSVDNMAGPIGVIDMIGDSYEATKSEGFGEMLQAIFEMTILISANLGVMNLLPIPALDGGRLVFLILEAFRGKPIDPEKEGMVHMIGFVALMLLMVFLVYNDISRIFG